MFKLHDLGWNICRQRIARIEACEAWVSDFEMLLIATAFNVEVKALFPPIRQQEPLYIALSRLLSGQVKTLMSPDDILLDRSARYLLPDGSAILSRVADKTPVGNPVVSSNIRTAMNDDRRKGCDTQPISQLAELLGVHALSLYWRIQRRTLDTCPAPSGKLLVPHAEVLRLGQAEKKHA
jgi:hypothetical protein